MGFSYLGCVVERSAAQTGWANEEPSGFRQKPLGIFDNPVQYQLLMLRQSALRVPAQEV